MGMSSSGTAVFAPRELPLELLDEAGWNANRVSKPVLERIRRSLSEYGVVENLVARPHPSEAGRFEVISGNHRLRLLRELGYVTAPVLVVELDDAQARLLAQTLNRTRGVDDPVAYARLLEQLLQSYTPGRVAEFLPESEATIDRLLRQYGSAQPEQVRELVPPAAPDSRPGEMYRLGPHRLLCGDATAPEQVAALMAGAEAALMATDPPYGVRVDHSWRDGVRQPAGSARSATLLNDDRAD
jgi:hypothetical protein